MGRIGDAVDLATLALLGVGGYILYKGVKDFKLPEWPAFTWPSFPGVVVSPTTNGGDGNTGGGVFPSDGVVLGGLIGSRWKLKNYGPQGGLSGAALETNTFTAIGVNGSIAAGAREEAYSNIGGGGNNAGSSFKGKRTKKTGSAKGLGGSIVGNGGIGAAVPATWGVGSTGAIGPIGFKPPTFIRGPAQTTRQVEKTFTNTSVPKDYRDAGNRVY